MNIHSMKLKPAPFEMIKSGKKTIELRLYDEKRQLIKPGDIIIFTNTSTGEILEKTVLKLHLFDSFTELYDLLPLLKCGYTEDDVDNAHPSDMELYYSREEQEKCGVVGIELYHNTTDQVISKASIFLEKINAYMQERDALDLKAVYGCLKDEYSLVLTNTFSLENGTDEYDEDFLILCGFSEAGEFRLYDDGLITFDVDKADGSHIHWHPTNIDEAISDVREFMQGICKEQC